ncbi:MAG: NADH-quinone oxidoreductase subunit NuoN [Rhodospirillaceae bacterium]|nr:NADH-quinone oxidoreductase subunit NuoN [Rhodospirillaceae bacterium]
MPVIIPAIPEIFLACAGMFLLMLGVFRRRNEADGLVYFGTMISLVAASLLVLFYGGAYDEPVFFGMFTSGAFSQFSKILILLGSVLAVILSYDYMAHDDNKIFEYPVLVLFATLGMMMMVSAGDLIALYIGLELQSLSLYVLAAIKRDNLKSTEAGLKYFVLGALSSGMLLYGASLIYGFAGSTDFLQIARGIESHQGDVSVGLIVGVVFLISGLAFKVSAVPFHMWTPDVYEGAPTPVTALFAISPKVAAICLFMQVLQGPLMSLVEQWQQIIVLISIASMVLGALAALVQTNIKRLMAYSSIGHMGYAMIGLAAANASGTSGVLIYMAIYLFMTVGTFACILCMQRGGQAVEGISDLAGLSRSHPMMAFALLIFMFSMAGIPPLAGFFGKWFIFLSAVDAGLYALAIIGVVTSVVSAFYYLRIIKIMYFDELSEALDKTMSRNLGVVIFCSMFMIIIFFFIPDPLVSMAKHAATSLLRGGV